MEYAKKELDLYNQGDRKKFPAYDQGRSTMFLDGRLIREVEYLRLSNTQTFIPAGFVGLFLFNADTPKDRVTYLKSFELDSDDGTLYATIASFVSFQFWANGNRVFSVTSPTYQTPIKHYIPPLSHITLYFVVVNFSGFSIYLNFNLDLLQFSAFDDIWDYGVGSGAQNPAGFPP